MALFFVLIILIPALDQIVKFWIKNNICDYCCVNTVIPFLRLTHVKNPGAAFGVLGGGRYFFVAVSLAVIFVLLYMLFVKKVRDKIFVLASSFIIGGGIGNLIDRVFFGYVTDYFKISFFPPVCNISDYFIFVGIVIMFFYVLKNNKDF